jgi:hypothetical protein
MLSLPPAPVLLADDPGCPFSAKYVSPVFQVDKCPQLRIPPDDHIPAFAAVAAVRPAFAGEFIPVEMDRTGPPFAGAAKDLDVVNKI